ncbi:restriction endonuclease subunit S [Prevotella sp. P6B1]|uniref:restriction endonuclease subunit S n=1 Tax=Prevotella sp. P6B1 TaxID=1410613 RepID=UPI00069001AD|nr:restriction endonuclease subunit S [Prevotella sp. P6B1]
MKLYEKYKDSEIQWIDKIPSHWKVISFKRLFSFGRGLAITKSDLVEEGTPVISYGQIHSKSNTGTKVDKNLLRYVPISFTENNESSKVHKGDFIFADTSEDLEGCGNCVYIDTQSQLYAGYHSIIARSLHNDDNKYLAYLFKTPCWRSQIRSSVNGVKVFSITQNTLAESTLILPSSEEQQIIASYLDYKVSKIDRLIAEKEHMLEDLKLYHSSIISEAVTKGIDNISHMKETGNSLFPIIPSNWSLEKLKYTGNFDNGLTYSPEEVSEEGILVLRSSNIQNGTLSFDDCVYVKEIPSSLKVEHGDIIICSRNGSAHLVGKCAYIDEINNATFGAFMMRYRPTIFGKFAFYAFQHSSSLYKGLYSTSTINQLTKNVIDQMYIAVPPLDVQKSIAHFIDEITLKINKSIMVLHNQIEDLKSYKTCIITEAVTGKVDLRDWNSKKVKL